MNLTQKTMNFILMSLGPHESCGVEITDVKVKSKAVPLHAMEALGGQKI
jgi:hypothetical protein